MKIRVLIDDKEVFVSNLDKAIKEEYYMAGKHSAINVAWYLVSYINNAGGKITNLKLQKILYYIQAESLKQNQEPLFYSPIEAWRHGPVVREVYSHYREYMNLPITDSYKPEIDNFTEREKELIQSVIGKKIKIDDWDLVNQTHKEAPWKDIYQDGSGINREITPESIADFFKDREI